ncbi:hypothetical protein G6011_04361 [Alternaria panax]|uniref:Uncharacterized protein n=1 Tax=Alternaria panax TaxID=48097 RepID=A0AAD4IH57_9PLEO|nr:hypothetical protein G6011_04361 [Alternaria panax]
MTFPESETFILRFPEREITAAGRLGETVRNEVVKKDSSSQPDPYLKMEYMKGTQSSKLFIDTKNANDQLKLDFVYEGLADYLLQTSRLDIFATGGISKDTSGTWTVTHRLRAVNMDALGSSTTRIRDSWSSEIGRNGILIWCIAKHPMNLEMRRSLTKM